MFVAVILMFSSNLSAQDTIKKSIHSISLKSQFFQFKDEFNYGLVFSGLNLAGWYSLEKTNEKSTFKYTPELSFGANYSKGVGLAWGIVPIDIFYGFQTKNIKNYPLTIGAYFTTDYNWQLYPELQSGHMFWFTSIEIGPQVICLVPIKQRSLKITLSSSLAGFTSRPKPSTESYYYSLTLSDFLTNANSNLEFGSYNLFNHTNLEVELLNVKKKRLSLAYEFEYFGFYKEPKLSYLSHSLNMKWKIGNYDF
jgi:hypothetical protein